MLKDKPNELFNNIFTNFMNRFLYISTLIYISNKSPKLEKETYSEQIMTLDDFINDEQLFSDKEQFLKNVGNLNGLAASLTQKTFQTYTDGINSACFLFIHTILDNSVNDFIKISMIISPDQWFEYLKESDNKIEITFKKIIKSTFDEIKSEFYNKKYLQITKKSLPNKISLVIQICNLVKCQESSILKYKYDKCKIDSLDKTRHEIVHGKNKLPIITNINDELEFFKDTFFHLFKMISLTYNLKLNQ